METVFTVSQYDYHYLLGMLKEPEVLRMLREGARPHGESVEVHLRDYDVLLLVDCIDAILRELRLNEPDSDNSGERLELLYDSIFRQTAE